MFVPFQAVCVSNLQMHRDMEQLSGGEKTMAALALLFSIHRRVIRHWSARPLTYFVVLLQLSPSTFLRTG